MTDLIDRSSSSEDADDGAARADAEAADVPAPGTRAASPPATPLALGAPDRGALAALLVAAGIIHLVMAPSHLGETALEGVGFLVAGWLQLGLALAVGLRPRRWVLQLSVLANLALVAVWVVSRTAGLPFGDHASHAETVSIVDGSVVALEVAAVLLALLLLARGAAVRTSNRALALSLPVAALVLASVAIGSPSARNHAAHSHGDHMAAGAGHAHGDEAAADDKGLSLLTNGHQHGDGVEELDDETQARLAVQLAGTMELIQRYPTVADAEAAGYLRSGPFAPGVGTHFRPPDQDISDRDGRIDADDVDPLLIFDGNEPDAPLAGFMYYVAGDEIPEGFAGGNDYWHHHTNVCVVTQEDGTIDTPFLADDENVTREDCTAIGGEWINATGNMLHVWTVPGYESPLGTFNEINPAITCPDGTYYTIPDDQVGYRESTCRNP